MRILQVCPAYLPAIGGVEQHVRNISERMARQHQVTIFAIDPGGSLPREEMVNGVLVRRFKGFSPGNAYHVSLQMLSELRRSQFDVVHGHNYQALTLFFCRYAPRERFVVTAHYHEHGATLPRDIMKRLYRPLGKKIFSDADSIVPVSSYERDLLLRDFRIDSGKVTVIPSGIDLQRFSGLKRDAARKQRVILSIGRLEEYKGMQHLIEVMPLLDANTRLQIVGHGPYRDHLLALARRLGVEQRVEFCQGLSQEELLHRFAGADLFALLSRYEAFGTVVAEALACGLPCIVADGSALREWIDNENCFGINYPIESTLLAGLIADTTGRKVGQVKIWDWEEVAAETLRVYQE